MLRFFQKPGRWAICWTLFLAVFCAFSLLDAFVIPHVGRAAESAAQTTRLSAEDAVITDTSYDDGNISITITTLRLYDTDIYVADILLADASLLKTALAGGAFGRNLKETTSAIAEEAGAIFAVNGDFYGFRDIGYVVRNGETYRSLARADGDDDALVIDTSGNFSIIRESETALAEVDTIWQVFSFGPALVEDSEIVTSASDMYGTADVSNPRTAIGQVSALHYVVVVCDGRTEVSAGLTLEQLAQVMLDQGCAVAYNLDGGGSSTMWFNGEIVNNPTDGHTAGERKVSDIVCIGY